MDFFFEFLDSVLKKIHSSFSVQTHPFILFTLLFTFLNYFDLFLVAVRFDRVSGSRLSGD
jgi:hypothetical protein